MERRAVVLAEATIMSASRFDAAVALDHLLALPQEATAVRAEEWTDTRLVRECLRGNEAAWSALLDKYKRLIYSIPVKYGFSPDEASDIFQETCVELLASLPRLREPRALPKWLMQVTAHNCAHLKERDRRLPLAYSADPDDDALGRVADGCRPMEQLLFDVEREQALRDAVASLSPRCRELIQMLFFESPPRPYKEVAERLEMSCGSIGFIRGRCLQKLRVRLQQDGLR
jgi:RNA polymerase sigma factor (sigma-70 family)